MPIIMPVKKKKTKLSIPYRTTGGKVLPHNTRRISLLLRFFISFPSLFYLFQVGKVRVEGIRGKIRFSSSNKDVF